MIAKKAVREKKTPIASTTVWEYPFDEGQLGIAQVDFTGNYPEQGFMRNKEIDVVYFVIKGTGTITIEQDVFEIAEGDAVYIKKGKKYKVWGDNLSILLSCAPDWYPEQYENVKD